MSSEVPRDDSAGRDNPRHEHLALQWQTGDGESRILARGRSALRLYRSDLVDSFPDGDVGTMTLGTIGEDGDFSPLIRRAYDPGSQDEAAEATADPAVADGTRDSQDR
jgi:hypothetical protein